MPALKKCQQAISFRDACTWLHSLLDFLSIKRIIWWHGKLLEGCKSTRVCSGTLTHTPAPVPAPGECTGNHHLLTSLSLARMIGFHGAAPAGKLHHGFHAVFEGHHCSPLCCLLVSHYKSMPLTVGFLSLTYFSCLPTKYQGLGKLQIMFKVSLFPSVRQRNDGSGWV